MVLLALVIMDSLLIVLIVDSHWVLHQLSLKVELFQHWHRPFALKAGLDSEMMSPYFLNSLMELDLMEAELNHLEISFLRLKSILLLLSFVGVVHVHLL